MVLLYMVDTPAEKELFERTYYAYRDKLFALALRILGNRQDAEDALQDAFLSVAKNFDRLENESEEHIVGYITVSVKNAAYNIKKRQKVSEELKEEYSAAGEESVPEELCKSETYETIINIIRDFNPTYRSVLYLFYVEEYTAKQIAQALDRSVPTVKSQLLRGKKLLKESICKELNIHEQQD